MDAKQKYQKGPRKNGNPGYPVSNLVTCELCKDKSSIPRYVGYDHGNGKSKTLVYHKYRCGVAAKDIYLVRILHPQIEKQFKDNPITNEGVSDLLKALDIVWRQQEAQVKLDTVRINQKIRGLNEKINTQAIAAIDPTNISIKQEILANIAESKDKVIELEDELSKLGQKADSDKERFLKFAFDFIDNMGARFLTIEKEDRLRCKQIVFPAGFYLNASKKVYTPEISPLYRLATTKKDAEASNMVQMVQHS